MCFEDSQSQYLFYSQEHPISVCTVYPKERSLSAMIFSIDTVSSDKEGREPAGCVPCTFFRIFEKPFQSGHSDRDEVRLRSIISDLKVEKIIISYRARDTATFSRLSPPIRFNDEIHADAPFGIGTIADREKNDIPSSPCTFSRFLMNKGSSLSSASVSSSG